MKKRNLSDDVVRKTVDVLDEVEEAVLQVKTQLKAGDRICGAGACPQAPYGNGTD